MGEVSKHPSPSHQPFDVIAMKVFITDDEMCTTQKLNLARVQVWLMTNDAQVVEDPSEADRILAMTCNGWSALEKKSYERLKSYDSDHPGKVISVGCVNDAHPETVRSFFKGPMVKTNSTLPLSFQGIEDLFPEFDVALKDIPAQSVFRRKEDYREYNLSKRFVNIAEGCAFHCSFCTHKPGLGRRRSRPVDDILEQISGCVRDGVKTVVLMGMETGLYGPDVGSTFPQLLDQVLKFDDSYEVHVAQFNPDGAARHVDALLPLFQNKRVSDIQMPVQSTSTRLLKMMNRKNHTATLEPFLQDLRAVNNRAVLRTDLIIGWPTETQEERTASLDFAGRNFDEIALYSIELHKDLPAWKYQDQALSETELEAVRRASREYLLENFDVVVHSGQQEDDAMANAEAMRRRLRDRKWAAPI